MDKTISDYLALRPGMLVQEFGWDDDVDETLRERIENITGEEILDEDATEVCDIILLWYREGDGDLADYLLDVIGLLADDGAVWVFTPKTGHDNYVHPIVINEAATTAVLAQTQTAPIGDWVGTKLVQPKSGRGKK